MLRFKQFIKENFIVEAKVSHFSHLGLDPNNPEHKDLVDAYNAGVNRDPNVPKNPNQIKTFDQLKSSVAPHYDAIQQKRQEDAEDKEAFANKEAELVHHDPSTGVKVFKVRSGKGCAAVGGDTKWCVADRKTGDTSFSDYDPKRRHSYVIHTPEKGNLSKIGIIGVKPGEEGETYDGANFQDKGNKTVSDENWEILKKKYNLNNVKALHDIRGLKNQEVENLTKNASNVSKNPDTTTEDLNTISRHVSDNPEVDKAIVKHKNVGSDSLGDIAERSNDPEIHKAIVNHKDAGDDALSAVAEKSNDQEVDRTILNHKNAGDRSLGVIAWKSNDPKVHRTILNHKNAGSSALGAIAERSDDPEIHRTIMNHPNAGDYALSNIAWKSDDPEIHRTIMNHPNAGHDTIESIAHKSNDPEIHKAIVNHKKSGNISLYNVAKNSDNSEIHKAIMNHPKVDRLALSAIAERSNDPEIHKAIMNHPKVDDNTKKILQKKINPSKQSDNPYQLESF